jgi:hypothetical protein
MASLTIRVGKNRKYINAKNSDKLLAPLLARSLLRAFAKTVSTNL